MVAVLNPFYRRSGCVQRKPVKLSFSKKHLIPQNNGFSIAVALQPYLDWASFCQHKKTGGQNGPLPNFSISSQMTIKLGKDILWGEIFVN